eukprot:1195172-Pyramimonas_sp.AAC.1
MMLAMGIPIYQRYATIMGINGAVFPSFDKYSKSELIFRVGNGMSVPVIGTLLQLVIATVKIKGITDPTSW